MRTVWMRACRFVVPLTALLLPIPSIAAEASGAPAQAPVFTLGSVDVHARRGTSPVVAETVLDAEQIQSLDRNTVGEAVNVLPGVSLARNSRNEDMVYLRGFDARQVPVFLDGIPLYVPYDGYVDFARFTTFDLAQIQVANGGASLLYGPNILGGAINLVSRRPQQPFEGDMRVGMADGGERKAAINLGGRHGDWYYQLGWSLLKADDFPLPDGFQDYKRTPTDTGSARQNADREDRRFSVKLGYTPREGDEYALGYARQDGRKGNPVYTGTARSGIRYWRWPYWDKDSLYFIGNTQLGANTTLRTRAYRDTYGNRLEAYTDGSYSVPLENSSFPSIYDDRTLGASLTLANTSLQRHALQLAVHYKQDEHEERNPRSPTKDYRDVTTSVALEDRIALTATSDLRVGIGHDRREARRVYQWPTGSADATNAVLEYVQQIAPDQQWYASAARRTRFPTIKDRYSARMGAALPNPDLKPEHANHLELGLRGQWWAGSQLQASLFHSRIDDLIQNAVVASNTCGGSTCNQAQNIGRARHVGVELGLHQQLGDRWNLEGSYTWLRRTNLENPDVALLDSPRQRLFLAADWQMLPELRLQATLEAEQGRKVSYADTSRPVRALPGFGVLGLKANWMPRADLGFDLGVRNVGDKWYELADGYPMPGRTWFANASWSF
ncbi:TonB-dependent receptor [Stenotrophomonas sp. SY1]|uniref:TonB-dependent receptor plug domain-containing protein n=1 Tax=Stenotrophomonas sp. SY1 TaxID=477235 RepID=UPI001E397721|nr:TonB-dependent receptor [Stenotrophomonas sp. SY1]MCD9087268.1 TonB-dependent receptor [Stenotrophomonas sp. SY1]